MTRTTLKTYINVDAKHDRRKIANNSQQMRIANDSNNNNCDDDYIPLESESIFDDDDCIDKKLSDDGDFEYVNDSYKPFEDTIWGNHIDKNENDSNYIQRLHQN